MFIIQFLNKLEKIILVGWKTELVKSWWVPLNTKYNNVHIVPYYLRCILEKTQLKFLYSNNFWRKHVVSILNMVDKGKKLNVTKDLQWIANDI